MVIVSNYQQVVNAKGQIVYETHEQCFCPSCQSPMEHRDWRSRHRKLGNEQTEWFKIERKYCKHCHSLHNVLPDFLVPFKHYTEQIIEDVIDNVITSDDPPYENYPCEDTMERWKAWILLNTNFIESMIRRIGVSVFNLGDAFLMTPKKLFIEIRNKCEKWLALILRMIYNIGCSLVPLPTTKSP